MQDVRFAATSTSGVRALCPHSRLSLVVPHAVCRRSSASDNLNDTDDDEMKGYYFEYCSFLI